MEGEDQSRRQVDETVYRSRGALRFTLLIGLSVDLEGDIGDGLAYDCKLRAIGLKEALVPARSH